MITFVGMKNALKITTSCKKWEKPCQDTGMKWKKSTCSWSLCFAKGLASKSWLITKRKYWTFVSRMAWKVFVQKASLSSWWKRSRKKWEKSWLVRDRQPKIGKLRCSKKRLSTLWKANSKWVKTDRMSLTITRPGKRKFKELRKHRSNCLGG